MEHQPNRVQNATEQALSVDFDQIPEVLKVCCNWVVWKYAPDEKGNLKKPPINPRSGRPADVTNPATWGSLTDAREAYEKGNLAGVGIVLTEHLKLVGLDFDGYAKDGNIDPRIERAIQKLDTYFEYSPSGEGLHGFLFGEISGDRRKNDKARIEMYSTQRYFTVTGKRIPFSAPTIAHSQVKLEQVYKWIFPTKTAQNSSQRDQRTYGEQDGKILLAADEIIRLASDPKNDPTFFRYFNGDKSLWGKGAKNATKSNADFTFCLKLAFWTNGDAFLIDQIFRRSGLFDRKWDRRTGNSTYGAITIKNAINTERNRR